MSTPQYTKERYQIRLNYGLCVLCGMSERPSTHVTCETCRQKARARMERKLGRPLRPWGSMGITEINAKKTVCHRGHQFDMVYVDKKGGNHRHCTTCRRLRTPLKGTRRAWTRTTCHRGHIYDRVYFRSNGTRHRYCSQCHNINRANRREKLACAA